MRGEISGFVDQGSEGLRMLHAMLAVNDVGGRGRRRASNANNTLGEINSVRSEIDGLVQEGRLSNGSTRDVRQGVRGSIGNGFLVVVRHW